MITDQLSHQESGGSNPLGHQPLPCDSIRDPFWDGENRRPVPSKVGLGWLISDLQGIKGINLSRSWLESLGGFKFKFIPVIPWFGI